MQYDFPNSHKNTVLKQTKGVLGKGPVLIPPPSSSPSHLSCISCRDCVSAVWDCLGSSPRPALRSEVELTKGKSLPESKCFGILISPHSVSLYTDFVQRSLSGAWICTVRFGYFFPFSFSALSRFFFKCLLFSIQRGNQGHFVTCRSDNSVSKEESKVPCFQNTAFVSYCFPMPGDGFDIPTY